MSWVLLITASFFEIVWAVGLKFTAGFTRPLPSLVTVVALVLSVGLLGLAARNLPIGTAYAVWTGLGAVGTVLVGIFWFGDPVAPARIASLALIILGVLGLKFA